FLEERITFQSIPRVIEEVMTRHAPGAVSSLGIVLEADAWARSQAQIIMKKGIG
ncbi:MAG: 1-deoxy-D-xylulose-5-phosphate reductoisomerase, partial [Syntrophaceae bacterium]|nr:1-deoxy-D-xylulose-5-phosphate reductoisomerase [Syntrophaceae bacterium]